MEDVARRAGVALSTVSYAINGTRPISQATRDRIDQAMLDLGYRPNPLARGLASKRSRILAIALPTSRRGLGRTELDFVSGALEAAEEHDHHLVVWPSEIHGRSDVEAMTGNGLVDGVLLMEVHLDDDRVVALTDAGRPVAMIGRTADPTGLAHVDIDFDQTLDDAVDHLVALGHQHIVFINHARAEFDHGYGPAVRAPASFVRAMERHGLAPLTCFAEDEPVAATEMARALLATNPELTAAVVMNEPAVPGLLRALSERGLQVPLDFSVMSVVSSVGVARMSVPSLTVLDAPSSTLGRKGVEVLLAVLADPDAEIIPELVPCRLVPGDSTGPAPRRSPPDQADRNRTTNPPGGG